MGKVSTFILLGLLSLYAEETKLPVELSEQYFQKSFVNTNNGVSLEKLTISSPPTPPKGLERTSVQTKDIENTSATATSKILTTPSFKWSFGCAATAAAMVAGYYDRNGYDKIYTGPTNGGVMPLDNSVWPTWTDSSGRSLSQCPLSATHKDLDGRTTLGHVDDYWVEYNDAGQDPYQSAGRSQHTYGDCTGDFMRTNQAVNYYDNDEYGNPDGATTFYAHQNVPDPLTASDMESYGIDTQDGAYGFKKFMESRGYKVTTLYTQKIDTVIDGGFSFAQYKAEIDAGHPVLILVKGHMMTGVGYNTDNNTVYLHDTWDYDLHSMTWGGSYAGMDQYGVTVIHLDPDDATAVPKSQQYVIPIGNNKAVVIIL
jgi:hypothetical protein